MKKSRSLLTFTVSLLLMAPVMSQDKIPGYDEIFDHEGKVREPYQRIVPIVEGMTPKKIEDFKTQTTQDFQGDNSLLHIPRVLTEEENRTLRQGVEQRARTISAFLQDHYSGKRLYEKAGIVSAQAIERIQSRANEAHLNEKITANHLAFWYGPDIIRGPDGKFKVIEDNLGFVGGFGDLLEAKNSLIRRNPAFQQAIVSPDPQAFYDNMVKSYRQRSQGGGKIVLLHYRGKDSSDNEEKRIRLIMENLGVETVPLKKKSKLSETENFLKVEEDGVYLRNKDGKNEKVGMVILDAEAVDVDPFNEKIFPQFIINEAKGNLEALEESKAKGKKLSKKDLKDMAELKRLLVTPHPKKILKYLNQAYSGYSKDDLKKLGVPGLLDAFYEGKVTVNNGPGFDFVGDKEMGLYMDQLTRFYLKEEPIIQTLPTRSFGIKNKSGQVVLNQELMGEVYGKKAGTKDKYVVKRVDGRGGNAVWVGPKISQTEFESVIPAIQEDPGAFIVQDYTPPFPNGWSYRGHSLSCGCTGGPF